MNLEFPDSAAIIAGDVRFELASLRPRIEALGQRLLEDGLGRVALLHDNGLPWLIADQALRQAGICAIPIPTWFTPSQVEHVLRTTGTQAALCAPGSGPAGDIVTDRVRLDDDFELVRFPAAGAEGALPPGTGKVTFTSGSTGTPKGVCLSNAQLALQAWALAEAVGLDRPRHLCVLPLSTLLENVAGVYAPLLRGGEVIVPSLAEIGFTGSSALDPSRFVATLSKARPDSLILTPQLLQLLLSATHKGWTPPGSLKFVAVGGAHVPPGLIEAAHARGLPVYEGYGLSECASVVSLNVPGAAKPGACGRALGHLNVRVVNGEICVTGNAMLGYAGEPGSWGARDIRTGDLGHFDDEGFLHIDGRRKNLIISSYGRNISPEWVESTVLGEGLFTDCVIYGDARPYCVALLSTGRQETPDSTIRTSIERVNRQLPDYAQIRRWHRLERPLAREQGLLTANGRPVREAIADHFRADIEQLYPAL